MFLFSESFLDNDFHLLVLTLAAILRFGFGFLVIWPTTSTPPLCGTALFRGLP